MNYSFVLLIALLAVMWFLLIRPQRRRQQEQARLIADLAAGDEIVTVGGLYGRIESLEENAVLLEIAPETTVRVAKTAVAGRREQVQSGEDPPVT